MSRNAYRHVVCEACWKERTQVEPHRVKMPDPEQCCYCLQGTVSGIYIRLEPALLPCQGTQGCHVGDEDA